MDEVELRTLILKTAREMSVLSGGPVSSLELSRTVLLRLPPVQKAAVRLEHPGFEHFVVVTVNEALAYLKAQQS